MNERRLTGSRAGVVDYPRPLAASISNSRFIYTETWPVQHCAGPGKADRGYLCAYSTVGSDNINPGLTKLFPIGSAAGKSGALIGFAPASGTGFTEAAGSFTVTAP